MESTETQPVKRGRGRPRKNPTPDTDVGTGAIKPPTDEVAATEWCRAVLWAAEHVNTAKMSQRQAGNLLRYSLWQFGRDNPKELIVQLVPKALNLLDKNKVSDDGEGIAEAENLAIKELESLLDGALLEAGLAP